MFSHPDCHISLKGLLLSVQQINESQEVNFYTSKRGRICKDATSFTRTISSKRECTHTFEYCFQGT